MDNCATLWALHGVHQTLNLKAFSAKTLKSTGLMPVIFKFSRASHAENRYEGHSETL
jgi:hypothetical protein